LAKLTKTERTLLVRLFVALGIGLVAGPSVFFLVDWLISPFKAVLEELSKSHPFIREAIDFLTFVLALGIMAGVGYLLFKWVQKAYAAWQGVLVHDQLQKLKDAREALIKAVEYVAAFERDLRTKSEQTERLQQELLSLKSLNAETAEELKKKLSALDILNRRRVWFERILSFGIGVASSLAAAYLWQIAQH
jgi:hypothetical protein